MATEYWSARAHVRVIGEAAIVFDIVADRYLRVPIARETPEIVLKDIAGAPILLDASQCAALRARGLLESPTGRASKGRAPWPREAAAVLSSCFWADRVLHARRLDRAVARLTYLKRLGARASDLRSLDAFETWRPLYPHDYVCLIDSLALAHYLLRGGGRPDLVIGVRDAPFSAHAWVVLDGEVVNDRLGQWSSYQPILEI